MQRQRATHLLNFIGSLLVPASALVVAPMLTRGLGPTDRGYLAADQALILIASAVVGLGLSDAASVAWHLWPAKVRAVITLAGIGATGAAATVGVVLADTGLGRAAIVVLGSVAFFIALQARGIALVRGDILGVALEKVATALARVVMTAGFLLLGELTVETALIALVIPQVVGAALIFARAWRKNSPRLHERVTRPNSAHLLAWALLGGVGGVLIVNLDSVYLIQVIGPAEVGYYAIAVLVAELFTAAAKPFRDAAFDEGALELTRRRRLLLTACGVLVAGGAACVFLFPWAIPFLFGSDFEAAVLASQIMVVGGVAKGLGYVMNGLLIRMNRLKLRTLATFVGLAVSVIALLPVVGWGAAGAALAKSVGYVVMLMTSWIALRPWKLGCGA